MLSRVLASFLQGAYVMGGVGGQRRESCTYPSTSQSGLGELVSGGTIKTAHSGDPQCPDDVRNAWGYLFKMMNPGQHPRPSELESLRLKPTNMHLDSCSR